MEDPCTHLAAVFDLQSSTNSVLNKYRKVIGWNVQRVEDTKRPNKRRKIAAPACGTCQLVLTRPFVCLHCSYAGCWTSGHITTHLRDTGHALCADITSGTVYCVECDNMVFDKRLNAVYLSATIAAEDRHPRFQFEGNIREPYRPFAPSAEDQVALDNFTPVPCQARRGLLNLGQTCYLNVVLQSFVHNPLLRAHFLSDRHYHKTCKLPPEANCVCCEMDKLFSEIYSPTTTPFGPTSFLFTSWRAGSSELSGYAQQDAHEFFISALNQIHTKSRGSTNVSCNCIIHSTFAGKLQSDVTCEKCGTVSSTHDDMLDVSLELKGENTLAGCLRKYTKPEKLGAKEYSCDKCGKASHEANKRLSIRTLPPVLSFQFKRFEHQMSDMSSPRKIETAVRLPATLNMAPFTTMGMQETNKENNTAGSMALSGPDSTFEYDLFAVINHEGGMNNGHYTNFARMGDEWYHFDDDKVTPSTLGATLDSMAYMCFYVRKRLDYKPIVVPTYVRARENAAVKEREREVKEREREVREKELKEAARNKEVADALMSLV